MQFRFILLATFVAVSSFFACREEEDNFEAEKKAALEQYADVVLASYEDSYEAALALQTQINAFVANPTAAGFDACKAAWLAARVPYGQTEAYRFYGGPIDDEDGPEGLINAWPMDENFIDYVEGNPNAGLINDPVNYPEITKQVLMDLNESISETSIFTGYHAIEFLLWGQDLSTSGPGNRTYMDYVAGSTANAERRGQYLKVVTELLLDNLAEVQAEWTVGGAYRTSFLALPTKTSLGYLFTAMGELSKGELAGERMFVAIDTRDQENEHSCFADNTNVDIKMNFLGIKNVYFGQYVRTDGTTVSGESIANIAQKVTATKAQAVEDAFEAAETAINAIPAPFDQAILNNAAVISTAVDALSDLSDRLADVGIDLGAEF